MTILSKWHAKQIDFVLAYTQADVEYDNMYMKVPRGFNIPGSDPKDCVPKLEKNLNGQNRVEGCRISISFHV